MKTSVHTHHATTYSRIDIDSHADTCAFGDGALIVHMTDQRGNVLPYTEELGPKEDVPIVTASVAYDCPTMYQTYILFYHQSLHIPGMERHLMAPAQVRENDVGVNDTPWFTPQTTRGPSCPTPSGRTTPPQTYISHYG